jgi:hypothetical protein
MRIRSPRRITDSAAACASPQRTFIIEQFGLDATAMTSSYAPMGVDELTAVMVRDEEWARAEQEKGA